LQEAIRARETQIIIGDEEVGMGDLLNNAFYWLLNHEFDDFTNAPKGFQDENQMNVPDHPESDRSSNTIDLVRNWRLIDKRYKTKTAELIDLLEGYWRFHATDPRDKIYAPLGICIDEAGAPRPNYAMTTPEVYLQYAHYFLTRGQGLRLLKQAGRQRSTMNIPSWVPDWTTNLTEGIVFTERECKTPGEILGAWGVGEIGVCDDPHLIYATGARIDQIVELGPPFPKYSSRP
jgi:hypothetical protein